MEQQGVKIRVRRGDVHVANPTNANGFTPATAPVMVTPSLAPPVVAVPVSTPAPGAPEPGVESTEGLHIMKSPIVGTFYAAPAPSAPPFVKVGDTVQVGQVLCIIEAMKLMNELEAQVEGRLFAPTSKMASRWSTANPCSPSNPRIRSSGVCRASRQPRVQELEEGRALTD